MKMSFTRCRIPLLAFIVFLLSRISRADVLVQLNVNRPLTDVSEKFVSFAIKPDDLYRALDGTNRKTLTRMAAMLGDSYIKFIGDYNFAVTSEMKLRNPTKVIWKGFNRWSRAINWTMIIPVPYTPKNWDPMETLRILNSSYLNGITDAVWQLGTDFGSSRAQDYVAELTTLNLMVDSFRPYVEDWRIMGADISAGSSADETMRYIQMSKDLNAAFGFTQPSEFSTSNSINSYVHDNDPALRVLLREKVPVWLNLPKKSKLRIANRQNNNKQDELIEGLDWAQALGEAASGGFDVIFKPIDAIDLERPTFTYYVSVIFKKVMGSRVFPARPLSMFAKSNKLYTHCANTVSGGIAFMMVNANDRPLQVAVRSLTKMTESEVWQYTLTTKNGAVLLNNERISLNSTLKPQINKKISSKSVQLSTPGRSVSFWVLPTVNLEHCQYTEVEAETIDKDSGERKIEKRYSSSSDKLLRKLIEESSLAHNPLVRAINRRRRYAKFANRAKRFILEDKTNQMSGLGKFFEKLTGPVDDDEEEKLLKKRENAVAPQSSYRPSAFEWFTKLVDGTIKAELPLLKRGTRSIDDNYFGPLFATKDGKTTAVITKKITEIKKPEKKIKPLFDLEEFDEEKFFKSIGNYREPEYTRLPEGDVLLKHITNAEGEEIDDEREEPKVTSKTKRQPAKHLVQQSIEETVSEMKPLRLLPTEFYEALPLNAFKPANNKFGLGGALNSLLFPEPFSKKATKAPAKTSVYKKAVSKAKEPIKIAADKKESETELYHKHFQEFFRAQKELSKAMLDDAAAAAASADEEHDEDEDNDDNNSKNDEVHEKTAEKKASPTPMPIVPKKSLEKFAKAKEEKKTTKEKKRNHFLDLLPQNFDNYFGENDDATETKDKDSSSQNQSNKEGDDLPWWDLTPLNRKRSRRALQFDIPEDLIHTNMIYKEDDDQQPLGSAVAPENLAIYEYRVEDVAGNKNHNRVDNVVTTPDKKESRFVTTVKAKVSTLVDIVARHVTEWYNTLTKHMDGDGEASKSGVHVTQV